ncbi:MAG: GAF domain-containing protein [Kofleriaceae bacterium]
MDRAIDVETILRLLPHGVLVVADDWRVTYANPEASRILGDGGTTLWERCPELEHTAFASGLRYAMSDHTELLTESALPSVGWCQLRARPMPLGGLLISIRQVHAHTMEAGQAKQALLMGEIGDALTREESLPAALRRCAEAIVRNLGAALARIWIARDRDELELCAQAGIERNDDSQRRLRVGLIEERSPEGDKIAAIAEDGSPFLTNDVATDPTFKGSWTRRERIVAFSGYPLRIEDRVVGVMAMYSRQPIDHDLLNSLPSIVDALALGIERKGADAGRRRAEDSLRTQAGNLEVLHELGNQLAAELDPGALHQQVIDAATRLANADLGGFFYSVSMKVSDMRYVLNGEPREAFAFPRIGTLLSPTLSGHRVRIDDVAADPTFASLPGSLGSLLAVPVVGRNGRVVGGLLFGSTRRAAFGEGTERLITNVAATAAIAMDNARLFEEAHALIAELEKSNRELDQFAYVASHDLKAPLRGIANLAQWIEEDIGDKMSGETREHLRLLQGRVSRLENLIGGILAYSRATRNRGDQGPIDVAVLAAETWELISPPETASLVISKPLPTAVGSRTQLQQVLMNLIGNALKYNPNRELRIEVGVRPAAEKFPYEFFVRDDGIGIAPEFHDKIWGLFQTLERRDKLESTGIGLSIVRKIVEAQGGRAWVESGINLGATFLFTWPTDPDGDLTHG